jgi:hypothetical protein
MGTAMARNLLKSGLFSSVTIWNRTLSKCDELKAEGALVGESPAAVVRACDVTFGMVRYGYVLSAMAGYRGTGGLLGEGSSALGTSVDLGSGAVAEAPSGRPNCVEGRILSSHAGILTDLTQMTRCGRWARPSTACCPTRSLRTPMPPWPPCLATTAFWSASALARGGFGLQAPAANVGARVHG